MEYLIFLLIAFWLDEWYEYKAFKRFLYIGPEQNKSIDELDAILCELAHENQMLNYKSGTLKEDFDKNGFFVFLYAGKKFVNTIAKYLDLVGNVNVEVLNKEKLCEKLSHMYEKDENESNSVFFKAFLQDSALNISIRFFGLDKNDISIKKLNVAMNNKLVKLRESNSNDNEEISEKKRRFYEKQIYDHHKLVFEWLKNNNSNININEQHSGTII